MVLGIKPRTNFVYSLTVSNMDTVIANIENCLGVTILDEWGQNIHAPNMRYVELDSMHPICLAWHEKADTSAIQILKEELLNYFHGT